MAKTNIGRVSVVPKDEYSSTENYKRLDVVSSDGSMYISKKDNNIGNPLTDKNWWFKAVEKGEKGDKPVNGVDYNTPEEKEEFKNDVVSKATEEVEKNIADIEAEAIENYNNNADAKTEEYDTNASNKLKTYNDNTTTKLKEYNDNASSKVSEFDTNATTQTETFNNNATSKTNDFNSNASTKTDEFNTNYEEKLESINEASTSIEQERVISDGKYARALKTQVTDVKSTQIYAENDVVDDLIINGVELTQETRDGYNKFNLDTIAENNYIDGYYENDSYGVLVGSSATNTSDYIEVKAGQSYLLKYDYDTLMNTGNRGFAFYNTNKEVINQKKNTMYNPSNKSNIFTALNQDGYLRFSYDINCTNIQLVDGPSPSLDFPSEVQVASEQNIQICQNNYLNTTQIANKDFSNSGLTVTTDENGIFTVNGTNTNQVNIDFSNLNFKVKEGQKLKIIKISGDISQSDNILNYINVLLWDKNYNTISLLNINNSNVNYTDIVNRIQVRFIIPSSTSSITYTNFKFGIMVVNADDNIQDYQPYYGTDITIALTNSAIGQYADTIDRENSVQNKFIQELTLTGSESDWTREDTAVGTRFFKPLQNSIISNTDNSYALCTHFKLIYSGGTYNVVGNLFTIYSVGSTNRIGFGSFTDISTVDEWKAKLKELYEAGTPVKIYYVSKTVNKIPLSSEVKQELDKFKLYDNLNNIFIDNGSLSFIYNKSLLRAFKEQSELSASLLDMIQALEQAQVNQVGGN